MAGETELAYMLIYSGILAVPGMMKLVEMVNQTFMIGKGYLKVNLLQLIRRMVSHFVKPRQRQVKIKGKTYDFTDHPDYMVYESGFFKAIPTIAIDEKSNSQIKLCNTSSGSDPAMVHGAGKIAYNQGYLDASGDFKKFSNYFMLLMLIGLGAVAVGIINLAGIVH